MKPQRTDWPFKPVNIIYLEAILAKHAIVVVCSSFLMTKMNLSCEFCNIFLNKKRFIMASQLKNFKYDWLLTTFSQLYVFSKFFLWTRHFQLHHALKLCDLPAYNSWIYSEQTSSRIGKLWRCIDYNISVYSFTKKDIFNCSTYPEHGTFSMVAFTVKPS